MGHRVLGRVATASAVLVLAVACAPGDARPGPAVTSSPAATVPTVSPTVPPVAVAPDATTVRDTGAPLGGAASTGDASGALLPVGGASLQVEDGTDGARRSTVTGAGGVLAWAAPPSGGRAEVQQDGSAVLLDAVGTVVAALGVPTAADGTRAAWRPDGDLLAVDGPAASFVVGSAAVESVTWGDADGGRSLLVVPAGWVRAGDLAAQRALASQLAAAEPEAATASMQAQLWCHVLGAPDKASWNLEPWRPEVSTATLLLTRCNPDA